MKRPWLAALLNFFFMGPGTLYVGVKEAAPPFYWPMFAAVFLMNTFFALDGWREAKAVNAKGA
jgi:hypothetical protein